MKPATHWRWPPALALTLLALAAYVPAMQGGFVWDDDEYVTNNPVLRSMNGLGRIWLDVGATPQYYPFTFTSFWIEHHLWGDRPFGYHVVNIVLHAANAVMLWLILTRLAVPGAWLAAAIFALHPVQAESVAWITERKNVLSGLFYLSAALAYLRFAGLPVQVVLLVITLILLEIQKLSWKQLIKSEMAFTKESNWKPIQQKRFLMSS